jgi:hypothetical protein
MGEERALQIVSAEWDAELSAFFPSRPRPLMERAWIAEKPRRLYKVSQRRWRRISVPQSPHESEHVARTRLSSLATRTHRLSQAVKSGDVKRLRSLFCSGVDWNSQHAGYGFMSGQTAFQAACLTGNAAVVSWLLLRGGTPHARDSKGQLAGFLVSQELTSLSRGSEMSAKLNEVSALLASVPLPLPPPPRASNSEQQRPRKELTSHDTRALVVRSEGAAGSACISRHRTNRVGQSSNPRQLYGAEDSQDFQRQLHVAKRQRVFAHFSAYTNISRS